MQLHAPSLRTWAAMPLDPDGEYGGLPMRRLVPGLLSPALAAAAVLLLLVEARLWEGLGLLAGAVVVAGVRAVRAGAVSPLAAHVLLRVLLLVGVGLAYDLKRPGEPVGVWCSVSILLLAVLGEPLLRRVLDGRTFVAAHLPGVPVLPALRLRQLFVPLTSAGLTLAGAVLAAFGVTAWVWLGLAVLTLAVPALVGLEAIHRHRVSARAKRNLARSVEKLRARVRRLRRTSGGGVVPGGDVAALPPADRTEVHHHHARRGAGPDARRVDRRARGVLQERGRARAGARADPDHGVLRQRGVGERADGPVQPPDARAPGAWRLGQGDVLQPVARDVRQGLLGRTRGHPALCRQRGVDPAGPVLHRRPAAAGGGGAGDGADRGGGRSHRAVRPDVAGARGGDPAVLAAGG